MDQDGGSTSTHAVVRLHIELTDKHGKPKEKVKKCTSQGHEVVEVDGFTFIRKRKATPEQVTDKPLAKRHEPTEAEATEPGASRHAQAEEQAVHSSGEPVVAAAWRGQAPGPSQAICPEVTLQDSALQYLQALPRSCPTALKVQHLVQHMVLQQAKQLDGQGGDHCMKAAERLNELFMEQLQRQIERSHSLLHTGTQAGLDEFAKLPSIIKEMSQGNIMKAALQKQLESIEEEKRQWLELQKEFEADATAEAIIQDTQGGTDADTAAVAADSSMSSGMVPTSNEAEPPMSMIDEGNGILAAKQKEVYQKVALQVEALDSMLMKVEMMLRYADKDCSMLQADFHREKFKMFPHVNSPAWLIKQMTQPSQADV